MARLDAEAYFRGCEYCIQENKKNFERKTKTAKKGVYVTVICCVLRPINWLNQSFFHSRVRKEILRSLNSLRLLKLCIYKA